MKSKATVVLLLLILLPKLILAQQDQLNNVIELPITIDEFHGEIVFDLKQLADIQGNSKRCEYAVIENFGSPDFQLQISQCFNIKGSIDWPLMDDIIDTVAIVIRSKLPINGKIENILFIGLDFQFKLHYFFNSTRFSSFSGNKNSFSFSEDEQFLNIELKCNGDRLDFVLLNPVYRESVHSLFNYTLKGKVSNFQIILSSGLHKGISILRYNPDTSQTISTVYYGAKIVDGFAFKVQGLYSIKKMNLGLFLEYENFNFENNTRIISSRRTTGQLNLNYSGQSNWPEQLLHVGITANYDLLFVKRLLVSPTAKFGMYFFTGEPKPFDINGPGQVKKDFKQRYSLGLGSMLKIPIKNLNFFTIGVYYQMNYFNASSYFVDIKTNTYHMRQEIYRLDIGFCHLF